jgi:very-short-patch-repair endonuclease
MMNTKSPTHPRVDLENICFSGDPDDLKVPIESLSEAGHFKYNKELILVAQKNRNNPTPAENKFWEEIISNKQTGFKFRRQKTIESFILDFYCSELLLCIEIDGEYHEAIKEQDKARTERLNILGIKVIRYTNKQVLEQIETVRKSLIVELKSRSDSLKPPFRGLGVSRSGEE